MKSKIGNQANTDWFFKKALERKEQSLLSVFKRNINNAEKILHMFKEPVDLDPRGTRLKKRHIIMKLCNDERLYLDYKKGKVDFGDEKRQPQF